jgi:hypothetical protein
MLTRRMRLLVTTAVVVAAATSLAVAQFGSAWPVATPDSFDGTFQFCRTVHRGVMGGDGGGWSTDYPDADLNLPTRLSELTRTPINRRPSGDPHHIVVEFTSPLLYRCPFIMAFEVGNFYLDEVEAKHLRDYLTKGGFFWVDDFWGPFAWTVWETMIRKALPAGEFPIVDLPMDHPVFQQFYTVTKKAQIPSINHWQAYRDTSERFAESRPAHIRGIADDKGRLMVLMTHNTDFGDSWEREGVSREYFVNFSVDGYAFGINALLYAMSH